LVGDGEAAARRQTGSALFGIAAPLAVPMAAASRHRCL